MALVLGTGTGQATACTAWAPLMPDTTSYMYSKDEPGESQYKNIAGGLDQPNYIRTAIATVPDMFKGVSLTPADGQELTGISILFQVIETWKVYDDASTSVSPLYFPASVHLVLKVPNHVLVTPTVAGDYLKRLMGSFYRTSNNSLSGAVTPYLKGITRT